MHDEVLQITSKKEASTWLVTRVYPVGDLVDANHTDLMTAITDTVAPKLGTRRTAQPA